MGADQGAVAPGIVENDLRSVRRAKGLTQGGLAGMAGVTRQAICAIEANQYLPATAVALRLAGALDCRVEDLFSLAPAGQLLEGELICKPGDQVASSPVRVKVAQVGARIVVRPVADLGGSLNFTVSADGLLQEPVGSSGRTGRRSTKVRVQLLRDRHAVEREIVVAGCDPAIFLLGEYLRRREGRASVVGWTMGSAAAVEALKRGEVHVAGMHIVDPDSGQWNLPYIRRHLKRQEVKVVTFAWWVQGLMIRSGNPKGIRGVVDLARRAVTLVNREPGAGARLLLDQQLKASGIGAHQIKGYHRLASSHLEVARLIAEGQADAGIGVESAARLLRLDFIPVQVERYDLVVPTALLNGHPNLSMFFDTLVSRAFRKEVEALGGYDTRESGKIMA